MKPKLKPAEAGASTVLCSVHVTAENMRETGMIGFSAAVEWIAQRGRELTLEEYDQRTGDAAEALVAALKGLKPNHAEQLVQGRPSTSRLRRHLPIPGGVWPNVVTREEDFGGGRYDLGLVGNDEEWGATLFGPGVEFEDLRIDTEFIRQHWPAGRRDINPANEGVRSRGRRGTPVEREQYAREILKTAPASILLLSMAELEGFVKVRFPGASRAQIRPLTKKLLWGDTPPKRGPKGKRTKARPQQLEEFRQKLELAELQNSTAE